MSTAVVVVLVLAAAAAGGCATGGGTPRPFPTPGGPGPRAPGRGPGGSHAGRPPALPAGAAGPLLDTALSVVGTPYRSGGDTPDAGFDCSGFVTWVFQQHGLVLPRTVDGLFDSGDAVEPDDGPAAADLVFFDTEGRGPTHVGIALGDGRFVHAPSSRGVVRVESLGGSYWVRRYLGARRVLAPALPTWGGPAGSPAPGR